MKSAFKKISLLTFHKDREKLTQILQDLGVVHLETNPDFRDDSIDELERKRHQLDRVVQLLEQTVKENKQEKSPSEDIELSVFEAADRVLELQRKKEESIQLRQSLAKDYVKLEPWGDFSRNKLNLLEKQRVYFHFYTAGKKEFHYYEFGSLHPEVINRGVNNIYFVVITRGEDPNLPFESVSLPDQSLFVLKTRLESVESEQKRIGESIRMYVSCLGRIKQELNELEIRILFLSVNGSYDSYAENRLLAIQGWFPVNMEDRLKYVLNRQKIAYSISDAQRDDKVPVLLNNSRYPKLFESVTRIFELPNYYEMDLTPFIAVFYPILFAYCLGDAGYGLILLIAAVLSWFTFLRDNRNFAILGIILGLTTTVMGIVKSGSVFGLPLTTEGVPLIAFLSNYVVIPDDRDYIFNAFNVALMIGVLQILTGIIVSIINKIKYRGTNEALGQFGKLFIVSSLIWIFLGDMQEMAAFQPFETLRKSMLALGILMVLLFHDMTVPALKRIASGVLPLFFIFTGILGDVLSYVRLFALGVASSVLGLVVNQIGMQIMETAGGGS